MLLFVLACRPEFVALTADPTVVRIAIEDVPESCPNGLGASPITMCGAATVALTPSVDGVLYAAAGAQYALNWWTIGKTGPLDVVGGSTITGEIEGCVHCEPGELMPDPGEIDGYMSWGLDAGGGVYVVAPVQVVLEVE